MIVVWFFVFIIITVLIIDFQRANIESNIKYQSIDREIDIDVVVTWVDSCNTNFIQIREQYLNKKNNEFRLPSSGDMSLEIKECVRLIFKNIPFVRKLIIVTMRPQKLNKNILHDLNNNDLDKLIHVHHDEFIPKKYLPTFNSNTIEMFIHLIPNLSNNYIYMNDDLYILKKTKISDFFVQNNTNKEIIPIFHCLKPCNFLIFNMYIIKIFSRFFPSHARTLIKNLSLMQTRSYFYNRSHTPVPLTKKIMNNAYLKYIRHFDANYKKLRFRHHEDILLILIAINIALLSGDALKPNKPLLTYEMDKLEKKHIVRMLDKNKYNFFSLNELHTENKVDKKRFLDLMDKF